MTESPDSPLGELVAHARDTHIVVIGGGAAGLVAALECAKVGVRVTVVEASDRVGGVLRSAEVDGLTVDVGAESYATRGGHVRALVTEVGLEGSIVRPAAGRAWVAGLPGGGAAPLPSGGVLGIPDNPWSAEVRRVIGWRGAWRAYLDRLRPPLTIGHERSLGRLVRSRMGDRVLERLVAPVTSGVYSARPDDIDVDVAAPGLSTALTRTGSLAGAVAQLAGARRGAPGAAVEGIDGGMARLAAALADRLSELGAELRTSARAVAIEGDVSGWRIALAPTDGAADIAAGADADDPGPATDSPAGPSADTALRADAVIVATPEGEARRLLGPVVPRLRTDVPAAAPVVEIVTLVLDAPALDAAPRGTGVLTVPGSYPAKALTHSTAKWPWLARDTAGRHVVRLSFGAQGEAPATAALDDADAAALALTQASALLGVALAPADVRGAHRIRHAQSQPASAMGQAERASADRAAVHAVPGLAAVGAWLAGTGLAQVVPDAIAEAERVRRSALFGRAATDR